MTKTFLRKYWTILISASCISTGVVLACADEWDGYGVSNFTPEAFVDSAYSPFFYSDQFYYGIGHDEAHITRFNNSNAAEWSAWLGGKATPGELNTLLDSTGAPAIDSADAWFHQPTAPRPASLGALRLLEDRNDAKASAFFRYLQLAKQCEAFSLTPIPDYWGEKTKTVKPKIDTALLNRSLRQGLAAAVDPFLKERYWFQLIRSAFFNGSPREAIGDFQAYAGQFRPDRTWYRSMAYMAGAYYRLKAYEHANYYYSRVFDSCDELKTVAHYSFHPEDETDWRATLALCTNNEQKATLWQMLGIFYSDPQRAIREIYALDPHSEKLDVLLSRAINESEQRFGRKRDAPAYSDSGDAPVSSDSSDKALQTLVSRIAGAANTAKPWVWQLAGGYLDMLDKQYAAADAWYGKALKILPPAPLPRAQYRLLQLLNRVSETRTMTPALEQAILSDLDWLKNMEKHPVDPAFRYTDALQWIKRTVADRYAAAGDKVKSECFVTSSAFYTDNRNVEALKAFLAKPNKTPYEAFCADISAMNRRDLFEFQAIRLCMNDRLAEALVAMRAVPTAKSAVLPGNPFNARIIDCHDCDHEAPQKIKYTKFSFLEKLKGLEDKIRAGQDVYTDALLLGNAQYNITQYGNARFFYECNVLGSDHGEPWSIDSVFLDQLMSMRTAMKYYTLALSMARTDEQKAKCQYLLAKCQRNEWYSQYYYNDPKNEWKDATPPAFTAWDGFRALKQYPGTQYYQEVIGECEYFRYYVRESAYHH